jgi:hypothetical protein
VAEHIEPTGSCHHPYAGISGPEPWGVRTADSGDLS